MNHLDPYLSLSTGKVFSCKLSKGGAGEGWLVCSTLAFSRGCTDFEARNRPFYDLVKESMVAHVDSGKTNLDDFECWLRQFHSERDHWGEKWGFFLERMFFFFRRERKDTPGFQRKTMWNEKGDESCRWITLKMNVVLCHDVQLDFSLAHC